MGFIRDVVRDVVRDSVRSIEGIGDQPFPTADLTFLWTGVTYESEGTTYYKNSKGNDVPVISGTGLDTILDFSVLNDVRLDKSNATYWGSTLNAYFYYDAGNPYHAKLKDFHYFYLNNQLETVTDYIFLKAGATTDTSNIIETIDSLLIYSVAQTDNNLSKLKTYIGIQDDFYGDSIIINGTFDTDSDWVKGNFWSISDGLAKYQPTASDFESLRQDLSCETDIGEISLDCVDNSANEVLKLNSGGGQIVLSVVYFEGGANDPLVGGVTYSKDIDINPINERIELRTSGKGTSGLLSIDNVSLRPKYINYYKKKVAA